MAGAVRRGAISGAQGQRSARQPHRQRWRQGQPRRCTPTGQAPPQGRAQHQRVLATARRHGVALGLQVGVQGIDALVQRRHREFKIGRTALARQRQAHFDRGSALILGQQGQHQRGALDGRVGIGTQAVGHVLQVLLLQQHQARGQHIGIALSAMRVQRGQLVAAVLGTELGAARKPVSALVGAARQGRGGARPEVRHRRRVAVGTGR